MSSLRKQERQSDLHQQQIINVRRVAVHAALKMYDGKNFHSSDLERQAKIIEKYIWGGFAPIERAPTPLSTIEECIDALKARMREWVQYSAAPLANPELIMGINAQVNRLEADISQLMEPK